VLVKLFMESECGSCDKYTTTFVKQMLTHIGTSFFTRVYKCENVHTHK
jgi:hypothetical protein